MISPKNTPSSSRLSNRPEDELLAPDTQMGAVTLRVADLDLMTRYYRDAVRLSVLSQKTGTSTHGAQITLGRLGLPVVTLEHSTALKHASPSQAGLYHTAVLFDTKADLAAAVYSTARQTPHSFTGSSDHLVSNAFYFNDPEGNGVELYWDRPRSAWNYINGIPDIGGDPLDPNTFLQDNLDEEALSRSDERPAKVGHVHLSVGDVPTAKQFYVDKLGFEVVGDLGTALFVSAGGYHHHMAMNTWNSRGAGPRQLTLGLGLVRITLPTTDDLSVLEERLRATSLPTRHDGRALRFTDPWANEIEVTPIRD